MNKKALSPLIATVLLVVFALVIGTVTMNLGKSYVEGEPTAEKEVEPFESSIIINIDDVLGDDLKELQIKYITGKITKEDVIESEVLLDLDPEQLSRTRARIFPLGGHFRGKINYIPGTDVMYGLFHFQLQFSR